MTGCVAHLRVTGGSQTRLTMPFLISGTALLAAATGGVPVGLIWALPGVLFAMLALAGAPQFITVKGLLGGGVALLALPVLWSGWAFDHFWNVDMRVLCLAMAVVLVAWLGALRTSRAVSRATGWLLVVAGLVCVVTVLRQSYLPDPAGLWMPSTPGTRPWGAFRQINVMASFLATCAAIGLHLWLTGRNRFLLPVLSGLGFAIALCQSTVGWLGVVLVTLLLGGLAWRLRRQGVVMAAGALGLGWGLARLITWLGGGGIISHEPGQLGRLQMWRACLHLIAEKPWSGHGYGTFVSIYPRALRDIGTVQLDHTVTTHPHNEILLWLVEGGLVAGLGLACLIAWGVLLFLRAWRDARAAGGYGKPGSDAIGWLVCTLPILLHTQVEYPLYQSPAHFTMLVLLLGLGASRLTTPLPVWQPGKRVSAGIRVTALVAGLAVIAFAVTGSRVATGIQIANQTTGLVVQPLTDAQKWNPWYMPNTVRFYQMLYDIRVYRVTRDPALLNHIAAVQKAYIAIRPDPNAYAMYLSVLRLRGDVTEYERVLNEARWRVSWDPRFAPASVQTHTGSVLTSSASNSNSQTKGD